MELSDELFVEIRKTLGLGDTAASADPATTGRRDAKRRNSRADASRARAEIDIPGTFTSRRRVTLIDFAPGGVSFFDSQAWGAGEKLVMYLPRSPEHLIPLLCIVRNSRVIDGYFRTGVEFVTHYEAGSMPVFSENRDATEAMSEGDAGRRRPRQRFSRKSTPARLHTYDREAAGPILEADVVDLSEGGVGLLCHMKLPPGRKLMVRLCPPGGKVITRMCEVVSCRRNDAGGYRVGTRFIEYKPSRSLPQMLIGWLKSKG